MGPSAKLPVPTAAAAFAKHRPEKRAPAALAATPKDRSVTSAEDALGSVAVTVTVGAAPSLRALETATVVALALE